MRLARPALALALLFTLACSPSVVPDAHAADDLVVGPVATLPPGSVPTDPLQVIAGTGTRFLVPPSDNANPGLYTPDDGHTWQPVPAGFGYQRDGEATELADETFGYGGTFLGMTQGSGKDLQRLQRWNPDTGTVTTFQPDLVDPFDDESEGLVVVDYVGSTTVLSDGRVFRLDGEQAVELHPVFAAGAPRSRRAALTRDGAFVVKAGSGLLAVAPTDGGPGAVTRKIPGLLSMDVSGMNIHYLTGTATRLKECRATATAPAKASCVTVAKGDYRRSRLVEHELGTSAGAAQVTVQTDRNSRRWIVQGGRVSRVASSLTWLPFRDTTKPVALAFAKGDALKAAVTVSAAGKATRLFVGPQESAPPSSLTLAGGRVVYNQRHYAVSTGVTWQTFSRSFDGTALGGPTRLTTREIYGTAASAGRTAVQWDRAANGNHHTVVFYDGTTRTGSYAAPARSWLNMAGGPYALVRTTVVRVDGHVVSTGPVMALFGSLVVEASSAGQVAGRTFQVRDLARPGEPPVPVALPQPDGRVYAAIGHYTQNPWRLWGEWLTVGYQDAGGSYGQLAFNYRTSRVVDLTGAGTVFGLGDDYVLLGNSDAGTAQVRVLGSARSTSLPVGAGFYEVTTDGVGTFGWSGPAGQQLTTVRGLAASPPRLLGTLAPSTFAAKGSRHWKPALDLTKAVAAGSLELRDRAGTLVRTLPTKATTTGSVRGVSWDGRDASGARVAAGTYAWTLVAQAADGSGLVTSVDGLRAATGTVRVTR